MMKTLVTATSFDNFFNLRCHKDAQPEIKMLADLMYQAIQESEPEVLKFVSDDDEMTAIKKGNKVLIDMMTIDCWAFCIPFHHSH